jgi:NlpC/P60 family putative phage cell wall peptidase
MTPEQRTAVIAEAESWIRTPYHSNAAVKGAGVDCAMLPLAVYTAALGMDPPKLPQYAMQWHLHRDEEKYLATVRDFGAVEIPFEELQPGDFVLWHIGRVYSHGAIVIKWPKIIHAVNPRGVVYGDVSCDEMLNRTGTTKPLYFTF